MRPQNILAESVPRSSATLEGRSALHRFSETPGLQKQHLFCFNFKDRSFRSLGDEVQASKAHVISRVRASGRGRRHPLELILMQLPVAQ